MTSRRTQLLKAGMQAASRPRTVNLPVTRASTVLFETVAEMEDIQRRFDADEPVPTYGITNMPLQAAFEEQMALLEGGYRAVTLPSGLAANAAAIMTAVKAGDHVLITDSTYGPTRKTCDRTLARFGVEVSYYDPTIGSGIEALIRPNTKAVYLENPGSYTFEVQDFPAIAAVARAHGAAVIHDNTWATGHFFASFRQGADLVVQAATKYPGGHSDVLIGSVVANEAWWPRLRDTTRDLGQTASPDDIFLALRGMRTLQVRLEAHEKSALEVAKALQAHPAVSRVLHPALPEDPGHALWKRDFTGSTGLFGIELIRTMPALVAEFVESLAHFGMGYSWGGFESLVMPARLKSVRTVRPWEGGPLIRLQIGLEDPQDLIADLGQGLDRLR